MKRITLSILAALLVPLTFWIGGMELNQRGEHQAIIFIATIFIAAWIYVFSNWIDQ